jgi:transcriptional regulator with XRE-family HTH domain
MEGRGLSLIATSLRWLIGTELARFRELSRLTLAEASARTRISRTKIHNMERGQQQQDPDDIARLLTTYGAPSRDIDRLTSLTGRADEATWWAPWAQVVPDWLRTYVGLEGLAESVTIFEPFVIPGLLQTQGYAAAVTAGSRTNRPDHGERLVEFRMARTRRLTDADRALSLHALIPEAALRLAVGGAEVYREQLEHLLSMMDRPNVTVQVIRIGDGPLGAASGFAMLDFGSAANPVVYVELNDGAVYLQEQLQVGVYKVLVNDLSQVAMGPDQSREAIAAMLGSL